ncbi:acetyl-CoA carboxylase biotin carboxylase subunit family protein [Streptomyces sp. NPDC090077]|uniref:ATP-grasp domain-containing protein n=1 Tax=Streptomyces sp. NPDC090077 TaxID=3365938 RepID=UPI00381C0E0D
MKILVLHQLPYQKADYGVAIDHLRHHVTYIGHPDRLADLPSGLRCRTVEVPPEEDFTAGVLARTRRGDGYRQVVSLSEFGTLTAPRVRAHLGIPGPDTEQVLRTHDKVHMKEALVRAGIRCPRHAAAPPPPGARLPWRGATVLKPRRGTCSQGVVLCAGPDEALARLRTLPDPAAYQLEEYVEGRILHADALVVAGRPRHCVVSRYVNTPAQYAAGLPLGSVQLPADPAREAYTARVVAALGIRTGTVHLEFFETPDGERVFLEVANRMGGAGVVTAHLRHTGVHLPSHEIAGLLGTEPPAPRPRSGRHHGWLVVPGHPLPDGSRPSADLPARLVRHRCVDRVHRPGPGTPPPASITYHEGLVPLALEVSDPDPAVLEDFLHTCADALTPRQEAAA